MNVEERLLDNGYDDVIFFTDFGYDNALIGVDVNNRAVYDYQKMIEWLVVNEEFTDEEAVDWIDYNTIRSLPYAGENAPIIMHPID